MAKNVLAIPFGRFEILTEVNREQKHGRLKIRIWTKGKTASYATWNIMTKTIDGIVGKQTKDQVSQAMLRSGSVLIPIPTYGYLSGVQLERGKIGRDLYNAWAESDLEKLTCV